MAVSVVIPAYSEVGGIGETVAGVKKALEDYEFEVIVVDDGSVDGTGAAAAEAGAVVARHGRNRGYGAAIKTGVGLARYDTICILDADCTYPPSAIPSLLSLLDGGRTVVSGCRFLGSNRGMPPVRLAGNMFFTALASILLMRRVRDVSSGMKVMSKATFRALEPLPDTFDLMVVVTVRSIRRGFVLVEAPIEYRGRRGESKLRAFRDGWTFLGSTVRTCLRG